MVQSLRQTVTFKQATIDKLTRFSAAQRSLLEETLDEDLQAASEEMAQHSAELTLPLNGVVLSPSFTQPFCAVLQPGSISSSPCICWKTAQIQQRNRLLSVLH